MLKPKRNVRLKTFNIIINNTVKADTKRCRGRGYRPTQAYWVHANHQLTKLSYTQHTMLSYTFTTFVDILFMYRPTG